MRRNSIIWLFIPLVFAVPTGAYAIYLYYEREFGTLPVFGKEILVDGKKVEHKVPDFSLTDQQGKTFTNHEWENKIVVVDFFFTHCPVICPKMTNSLKQVQESFTHDEINIASISIDPKRDDPGRLRWYTTKFGIDTSNWRLLTGDKKEIYRLARNGFMIVATDGDGGPDDFIHSEKLVLIDRQKRIRGYYDGTSGKEVNTLIQDIKKLKNEK